MYSGKWIDGLMEKTCPAVTDGRARFTRGFNCSISQWKCAELTKQIVLWYVSVLSEQFRLYNWFKGNTVQT